MAGYSPRQILYKLLHDDLQFYKAFCVVQYIVDPNLDDECYVLSCVDGVRAYTLDLHILWREQLKQYALAMFHVGVPAPDEDFDWSYGMLGYDEYSYLLLRKDLPKIAKNIPDWLLNGQCPDCKGHGTHDDRDALEMLPCVTCDGNGEIV